MSDVPAVPETARTTEERPVAERVRGRHSWAAALASGRGHMLPVRIGTLVLLTAAVLLIGALNESTVRYSLVIGTIYAIAVLGNNAINGALGEINLAAGAYMATGAYVSAWMLTEGYSLPLTFLAVVVGSAVVGVLLAVPTVRLGGIFTALATFALAYAVPDLALYLRDFTGGDAGTPVPPLVLGGEFVDGSSMSMLLVVSAIFLVAAVLTLWVTASRLGVSVLLVGESTQAAQVFGIRVTLVKVAVWTWAAVLGGVAGALYGLTVGFLSPTIFVVFLSISLFVAGLIGGTRNVAGAWLGGLVVGALPSNIQNFVPANASGVVFGAVLLLALLVGTGGLAGLIDRAAVAVGSRRST